MCAASGRCTHDIDTRDVVAYTDTVCHNLELDDDLGSEGSERLDVYEAKAERAYLIEKT